MTYSGNFDDFKNAFEPIEIAEVNAVLVSSDSFNSSFSIEEVLSGDPSIKNEIFTIDNHEHELAIPYTEEDDEPYPSKFSATLEVVVDRFVPSIRCKEINEEDNL